MAKRQRRGVRVAFSAIRRRSAPARRCACNATGRASRARCSTASTFRSRSRPSATGAGRHECGRGRPPPSAPATTRASSRSPAPSLTWRGTQRSAPPRWRRRFSIRAWTARSTEGTVPCESAGRLAPDRRRILPPAEVPGRGRAESSPRLGDKSCNPWQHDLRGPDLHVDFADLLRRQPLFLVAGLEGLSRPGFPGVQLAMRGTQPALRDRHGGGNPPFPNGVWRAD